MLVCLILCLRALFQFPIKQSVQGGSLDLCRGALALGLVDSTLGDENFVTRVSGSHFDFASSWATSGFVFFIPHSIVAPMGARCRLWGPPPFARGGGHAERIVRLRSCWSCSWCVAVIYQTIKNNLHPNSHGIKLASIILHWRRHHNSPGGAFTSV